MKFLRLVMFTLLVAGFCAHLNTHASGLLLTNPKISNDLENATRNAEKGVAEFFGKSAHWLPDVCAFTNDSKASVWVNQIINGKPNAFTEIKAGASMWPIKGNFNVTTRDPKKYYTADVRFGAQAYTFTVNPVKDCKQNRLRFSQLQESKLENKLGRIKK